jgi:hypothetical protein
MRKPLWDQRGFTSRSQEPLRGLQFGLRCFLSDAELFHLSMRNLPARIHIAKEKVKKEKILANFL